MSLLDKLKDKISPKTEPKKDMWTTPKVSVLMQDGTIEEYPKNFIITDGMNCAVCMGKVYHTSLDCENLEWEMSNCAEKLRGMDVSEAKRKKMAYCSNCSRQLYLWEHGREDEI